MPDTPFYAFPQSADEKRIKVAGLKFKKNWSSDIRKAQVTEKNSIGETWIMVVQTFFFQIQFCFSDVDYFFIVSFILSDDNLVYDFVYKTISIQKTPFSISVVTAAIVAVILFIQNFQIVFANYFMYIIQKG